MFHINYPTAQVAVLESDLLAFGLTGELPRVHKIPSGYGPLRACISCGVTGSTLSEWFILRPGMQFVFDNGDKIICDSNMRITVSRADSGVNIDELVSIITAFAEEVFGDIDDTNKPF